MTVPHLMTVCREAQALRELRSLCKEARLLSSGLFTGLTVQLDKPLSAMLSLEFPTMLTGCRLRRLCVVLHMEYYGELKKALNWQPQNSCH